MSDEEVKRIGLVTGVQAGFFVGVFLGFSLAVVSSLTQPEALAMTAQFLCITPFITAVLLGPFLAWRKVPVALTVDPLPELQRILEGFNEGVGRWRVLSHVRSDGRTVRVDLHDARDPLAIAKTALHQCQHHPVRLVVGRGQQNSRQPELRTMIMSHVEANVPMHRRRGLTSSVEVMPPSYIEHLKATQHMHRRLLMLVPVAMALVWWELR
ncbi:MAG: hypothetical protein L7S02_01550 [Flavobacteriales bacterium]|nr:hypothetical protein [Flavobacteriales bacterium]